MFQENFSLKYTEEIHDKDFLQVEFTQGCTFRGGVH